MAKNKKYKTPKIELNFVDPEDLQILSETDVFIELIRDETVKAIRNANDKNEHTAIIMDVTNLHQEVVLTETQFKPVIDHIIKYHVSIENFEEAGKLQELFKKL